jgi:hypothetical protein
MSMNSQVNSSTKPRVNWVPFPTDGLYGEADAASQTSRSGDDMCIAGGVGVAVHMAAAKVSSTTHASEAPARLPAASALPCSNVVHTRRRLKQERAGNHRDCHTRPWLPPKTVSAPSRSSTPSCVPPQPRDFRRNHHGQRGTVQTTTPPTNSFTPLPQSPGYSSSPDVSPVAFPISLPTPQASPSSPEVPLMFPANDTLLAAKRKAAQSIDSASPSKRPKKETSETPSDVAPPTKRIVPFPEKPAVIEERNGEIEFQVVNNDGRRDSSIILTGLKCIFQKQLPKMPKDYIARLVYDRTHLSIAIVKKPLEVVGYVASPWSNDLLFPH